MFSPPKYIWIIYDVKNRIKMFLANLASLFDSRRSVQFLICATCQRYMGPVVRKPVFGVSDKASFKPAFTATETSKFTYDIFQKANNKGADQTVGIRRLVCTCVIRTPPPPPPPPPPPSTKTGIWWMLKYRCQYMLASYTCMFKEWLWAWVVGTKIFWADPYI